MRWRCSTNGRAVLGGGTDNTLHPMRCAPQPTFGGGSFDSTLVVLDLLPWPVQRFGSSSPLCRSVISSQVSSQPWPGNARFAFLCNQAPASAPGVLLLGTPLPPPGVPVLGAVLHVWPMLPAFGVVANASGFARFPLPVPANVILPLGAGSQWIWPVGSPCQGELLAGSDALRF